MHKSAVTTIKDKTRAIIISDGSSCATKDCVCAWISCDKWDIRTWDPRRTQTGRVCLNCANGRMNYRNGNKCTTFDDDRPPVDIDASKFRMPTVACRRSSGHLIRRKNKKKKHKRRILKN